jgi:hypothetical protein
MTVATLRAETILPATLERAASQPLLIAALEDAVIDKPLLFFFLRELIWYMATSSRKFTARYLLASEVTGDTASPAPVSHQVTSSA